MQTFKKKTLQKSRRKPLDHRGHIRSPSIVALKIISLDLPAQIPPENPECSWAAAPGGRRTADEHGADGEDLLSVGVGTHVAKAHAGQAAEGEVEGGDVGAGNGGASRRAVDVRRLQTLPQLLQPAWPTKSCGRFQTLQKLKKK